MKTQVIITKMSDTTETVKDFSTKNNARQFFNQWCDSHEYDYKNKSIEAGGIGYDFRIELKQSIY
jgi:hypothetical protein